MFSVNVTPFSSRTRLTPDVNALLALLARFAAFGATPAGGVTRLCASAEDGRARALFEATLTDSGAATKTDGVGNQFGLFPLAGRTDAPIVMMGSHLDSQYRAGTLDGTLGVAASLCVGQALMDARRRGARFDANFCAVNWTNEEGARFRPSLLGSGTFAGAFSEAFALERRDDQGISLRQALDAIGFRRTDVSPPMPACYLELHVEQGSVLEAARAQIGVVVRNWGATKIDVVLLGEQAHTGPTPMARRRDALLGAAYLIAAIRTIADRWPGLVHASVGRIVVLPNSANVVPARADLAVELRSAHDRLLVEAGKLAEAAIAEAAGRAGVEAAVAQRSDRLIRALPTAVCALVSLCAKETGHRSVRMDTVSGHDALSMLGLCPTGLVFVPSIGGITHNEAEATAEADLAAGLAVSTRAVDRLCRTGGSPEKAVKLAME
jgi:N-carbamoyl-L-amino-acid hydrolase